MKKTARRLLAFVLVLTLVVAGTPVSVSAGHAPGEDHDWFLGHAAFDTAPDYKARILRFLED